MHLPLRIFGKAQMYDEPKSGYRFAGDSTRIECTIKQGKEWRLEIKNQPLSFVYQFEKSRILAIEIAGFFLINRVKNNKVGVELDAIISVTA